LQAKTIKILTLWWDPFDNLHGCIELFSYFLWPFGSYITWLVILIKVVEN